MGMTTTMLAEDLKKQGLSSDSDRAAIIATFQSRIRNILEHVKYDINAIRENALIPLSDIKDLYMITDMFGMQLDELARLLNSESYSNR